MDILINLQNALLSFQNPALLPLLAIPYSFLTSPHCFLMCSAQIPSCKQEPFYIGRLISYTLAGALLGFFGQGLLKSLEIKALSALAFFVYALVTLIILGFPILRKWKPSFFPQLSPKSSFLRGLLMLFMPCHLLYFFYSLAILSANSWAGALILLGHGICSMPALAYGRSYLEKILSKLPIGKTALLALIYLICTLNLVYFGSRLFYEESEAKNKILFCF